MFGLAKYDTNSNSFTASSALYRKLGVLKIHDLYYYNLALLAFDARNSCDFPILLRQKFKLSSESSQTSMNLRGADYKFHVEVPRLMSSYQKPSQAAAIMWNKLPNAIRTISSKFNFKTKIKEYFIEQY